MPIKRVFQLLTGKKEQTQPKADVELKAELSEAIQRLQAFSDSVKKELDFIDEANREHRIPRDLLKEGEDENA